MLFYEECMGPKVFCEEETDCILSLQKTASMFAKSKHQIIRKQPENITQAVTEANKVS